MRTSRTRGTAVPRPAANAAPPVAQARSTSPATTTAGAVAVAGVPARGAPAGAERARLADPRTGELIRRGGFARFAERFPATLHEARGVRAAERLVDAWGTALWQAAVDRAQGRWPGGDGPGDGPAPGDDRPLYWTRLAMADRLERWQPRFPVDRAALRTRFEDASRGLRDNGFRPRPGVRRIFVSGFDPFNLDRDVRTANPSGAAALALNGRRITLDDGTRAEVRAVVLPVRYADFDRGLVERAFAPRMAAGPRAADLITTISQGYPDRFTLEEWAGRARSADPHTDNDGLLSGGTRDRPVTAPGMGLGPEFIRSTLPAGAMTAAADTPYPVLLNSAVTEIPAGGTSPADRTDGPTPGARAVAGGGGGYLSNEVAYRSNRLRLELRPGLPGGHLHTPVLTGLPADGTLLTGPEFEANQAAITAEILAVLKAC
ncbi:pyroglutamyl peptidase [Kitasatospora sp. NPDC056138]|uniref:pyroglutamyl peptidase n=1 Tax=Kitasatospora sp. NPDC056138 TaxID=3345724 RepID=UPI0035D6CB13